MSSPPRPIIDCDQQHATFAVAVLDEAIAFYCDRLGFALDFTWGEPPHFAGVRLGKMQMFLDAGGERTGTGSVSFIVGDVDALHAFHMANAVPIGVAIEDRDYGIRDYGVRDPWGNWLSFGQHIYTVGEPIVVERVDVPLRLEKRLAALLHDLAHDKRMNLTQLMEETLLHTLEGVGPHTEAQLRRIAQLRQQHGIDYDSHGSYRFTER